MYSQHNALIFVRDNINMLHTSTQTRLTPVAKHALYFAAYRWMGNSMTQAETGYRRGTILTSKRVARLPLIYKYDTTRYKARDKYSSII